MFKGIVEEIGLVTNVVEEDLQSILTIYSPPIAQKSQLGSSVACGGVCLSVTWLDSESMRFYVSHETLDKTNLSDISEGSKINLESSLKLGDTIDGHLVQGHVDTTAQIVSIEDIGDSHVFKFSMPEKIAPYIAFKGGVSVDGTSLTVNEVGDEYFTVNIIPYTYTHTTFHANSPGDTVNIEVDLIARYLKRFFDYDHAQCSTK